MRTFSPLLDVDAEDPWTTVTRLPAVTLERLGVEGVTPRDFRRAMKKLGALPPDNPQRRENESQWRSAIPQMKQLATEVFDSAEAMELDMALEAGSVTLISDGTRLEDATDQQVQWFRDRLVDALSNPRSHVLLDEVTTEFMRESGAYADGFPGLADLRTRRASVGTGLLERLPTFPDAPMEQVLEARAELAEGRAKYRSTAKHLADKLQSSALDATLPSEIDELWHDEVRPSLEDLRKSAMKTRVAVETGKRLVTEGYGVPTILVAIANLPDLAVALPTPAAAAAVLGRIAAAGAREAFLSRSAIRQHDLVYLLDVDKRLRRPRR